MTKVKKTDNTKKTEAQEAQEDQIQIDKLTVKQLNRILADVKLLKSTYEFKAIAFENTGFGNPEDIKACVLLSILEKFCLREIDEKK